MAKICSICSSPQAVQEQILQWHKDGKSYREIEALLENEGRLNISNSSIGRHFKNCAFQGKDKKGNASTFQKVINTPKPDGADMHNALCHILNHGIEMFFQRMEETGEKTTPYSVHLETYRCLDMLIKMLESLYPNSAKLAEEKHKREQKSALNKQNTFQQDVLYKLFTLNKKMNPEEYKEFILQEIDKAKSLYREEDTNSLDHATLNVKKEGETTKPENK